jgi:hypothetical protein
MSPEIAELIAPLVALLGVGTFILIGMKMKLDAKVRLHGGTREDVERLGEAVEILRDEVRSMRGDVLELQERVDFAERVLTKGQPDRESEHGASTPV